MCIYLIQTELFHKDKDPLASITRILKKKKNNNNNNNTQ